MRKIIDNPQNPGGNLADEHRGATGQGCRAGDAGSGDLRQANRTPSTGARKNSSLVAVSTGLLHSMNEREVEAVLATIAHIANGDMVTLTLIQGGQYLRYLPGARRGLRGVDQFCARMTNR